MSSAGPTGPMPPTVPAPQTQEQFVHLLSSREMQLYPDATPAGVVVHLMGVRNVPKPPDLKMQGLSTFVVMNVVDHCGAAVGRCVSWPPKRGTCHPVWNSGRDLSLPRRSYGELARSLLRVELWHHDPFMLGQRIGQARARPLLCCPCVSIRGPLLSQCLLSSVARTE